MIKWLGVGERYILTSLDFWRLRPRRFMMRREARPSRYLSPVQFLLVSLIIFFGLNFLIFSFPNVRESISWILSSDDPRMYGAVLAVLYTIVALLLGSILYLAISKLWPIRGPATYLQIIEFQCYMTAISLPMTGLMVVIAPCWRTFVGDGSIGIEDLGLAINATIILYSILTALFWQWPGIAVLNRTSTARIGLAVVFWLFVVLVVLFVCIIGLVTVRLSFLD